MEIIELAHQLGELIKASPEMVRMEMAESAFNADAELHALIDEYNAQDSALGENSDAAFAEAIRERMNALYEKVTANPIYAEYVAAQKDVHKLMHGVNDEINFVVTGEHTCDHENCESCEGCH